MDAGIKRTVAPGRRAVRVALAAALLSGLLPGAIGQGLDIQEIVRQARTFIGEEKALSSLSSIRYVGRIEGSGPAPFQGTIDIILKKPMQQRIEVRTEPSGNTAGQLIVSALNDYEGWRTVRDAGNPSDWRLLLLDRQQVRRLRANTWENLNFFKGIEAVGGRCRQAGSGEVDGRPCYKLAFHHLGEIVFIRHFDQATGELLLTETETGGTLREQGEMIVEGIRFPRRVVTREPDGRQTTIHFERIVINEAYAEDLFEVPHLLR